jgi:hypothetical protein
VLGKLDSFRIQSSCQTRRAAVRTHLSFWEWLRPLIPTGLRPPAQGCEEQATLGQRPKESSTLKGLRQRLDDCQTARRGCHNPFRVVSHLCVSPRVALRATLGFEPESRWDSPGEK